MLPAMVLSWYLNDEGKKGSPCLAEVTMLLVGLTCNTGALTVSVAIRVWVPELSKVMLVGPYVPGVKLFALALTVNVTIVPVDAVPDVGEGVSHGGPDIEKFTLPATR
jgi:hypothetical protein